MHTEFSPTEAQISLRFAPRPAIFEIRAFRKTEMHPMTPKWPQGLKCQKYTLYTEYSPPRPKFQSVSLYDQPLSRCRLGMHQSQFSAHCCICCGTILRLFRRVGPIKTWSVCQQTRMPLKSQGWLDWHDLVRHTRAIVSWCWRPIQHFPSVDHWWNRKQTETTPGLWYITVSIAWYTSASGPLAAVICMIQSPEWDKMWGGGGGDSNLC